MTGFEIVGSVALVIVCIALIVIVLAQHGKSNYLGGAISGGAAESFLGKNKARTIDSLLGKITRVLAIVFVLLTIIVSAVALFKK